MCSTCTNVNRRGANDIRGISRVSESIRVVVLFSNPLLKIGHIRNIEFITKKKQRLSTLHHSSVRNDLPVDADRFMIAFATMSSTAPLRMPERMSRAMSRSGPSNVTPSNARTTKNSGRSKVISWLSSKPKPWSARCDKVSHLPMLVPGRWCIAKSKRER